MRFRLSWVSVAVGLLVAALFLVPTASRVDVQVVVLANGTVEKQLVTKYFSLGSVLIGHFFRGTSRLDRVSIVPGVMIAAAVPSASPAAPADTLRGALQPARQPD